MGNLRRRILVAAILAAGLAAAGWLWWGRRGATSGSRFVSGNIELTEVRISFPLAGQLAERRVNEGERVKKGQILATLDREQVERNRDRARAAVQAAESRRAQLEAALAFQRESVEGQVEQRRAELKQAQALLEEMLAGSRRQEVEQARAAAEAARTEWENAKRDWERAQSLHQSGDIATANWDRLRTRHESADAAWKQARERLALVEEGPRKEDIASARAQVERARAGLRLAEAGRLDLRRMERELETRRAEIEQARAELAAMEAQLADMVATSPIDGVVLVKAAEPGEVLAAGAPVLVVGDLDRPWLRAYITEADLGRVRLGAPAKVTTDSFPGKVYAGRVSFVSSEAEFTPKQIQTSEERVKLVYRIKIDVENPHGELKSNMPADAEIRLDGERRDR
jgi:HlyD family secretion protein